MKSCYICGNLAEYFETIQDIQSNYSETLFTELIESISGFSVDQPSIICESCITKVNDYDEYSRKAEEIQAELKMLIDHRIYIKDELDNVSIGSYETEMNTDNENEEIEETIIENTPSNVSAHFDWNSIKNTDEARANTIDSLQKPKKTYRKRKTKTDDVFLCSYPECERRFGTKPKLLHHLQLHSKERPFQCSFCGKFYKTKPCLQSHQRIVHKNANLRVICDACGRAFTRKPSLERHYKAAHLKLRSFTCQTCGASYCNASSLQAHYFVHNKDDKNFACEICSARFHTRSKLNRHMRCHREKQFECPICRRKYSQPYNLTAHIKQVHEEYHLTKSEQTQPVCQLCGKLFDRQTSLTKHLKSAHDAVPISGSLD